MLNPLISIIVPAYNVENIVEYTLNSIINQTYDNFECIIVDDFSKDKTKEICINHSKKDTRLKVVSHRANGGLSAARNTGLRFAKGKYVCFLDSDDLFMKDSLELRVQSMIGCDSDVIGTYCGSIAIDQDCKLPPESRKTNLKVIDFITAGGNCPFNANQPMFITKEFKKFGGFDQTLKQAEDYDMWMRILRGGNKIIPTNFFAVTYRSSEGSMIKQDPLLHLKNSYECYENAQKKLDEYSHSNEDANIFTYLDKGLSDYIKQLNIANRVLEFIGMALAKGETEFLAEQLQKYLPDYFKVIERHRPFERGLIKGINRYFGSDIQKDKKLLNNFRGKINSIKNEFKKKSNLKSLYRYNYKQSQLIKRRSEFVLNSSHIVNQLSGQTLIDIIFIPHKDYHVSTIELMRPYLDANGIKFIIVDISMHYRDEGVQNKASELKLPVVGYSNFLLGEFSPKLLVSFNDWDPIVRSIFLCAQKTNIATACIVEGIQDYLDSDTGQIRNAYRIADYVLLPGQHDRKYFSDSPQQIRVVGVPRIFSLRNQKKKIDFRKKTALINSNFSYGVLENRRDEWLNSAVEACLTAGYKPIVSRHPADRGNLYKEYQTKDDFYSAVSKTEVHISRFASGLLEALSLDRPVIYFNPHNERVDKFKSPMGAYKEVKSKNELIDELKIISQFKNKYLKNAESFLDYHCGPKSVDSSKLCSDELAKIVSKIDTNDYCLKIMKFKNLLCELDKISGSFNNIKILREMNKNNLDKISDNKNMKRSISLCNQLIRKKRYDEALKEFKMIISKDPNNTSYHFLYDQFLEYLELKNKQMNS